MQGYPPAEELFQGGLAPLIGPGTKEELAEAQAAQAAESKRFFPCMSPARMLALCLFASRPPALRPQTAFH